MILMIQYTISMNEKDKTRKNCLCQKQIKANISNASMVLRRKKEKYLKQNVAHMRYPPWYPPDERPANRPGGLSSGYPALPPISRSYPPG